LEPTLETPTISFLRHAAVLFSPPPSARPPARARSIELTVRPVCTESTCTIEDGLSCPATGECVPIAYRPSGLTAATLSIDSRRIRPGRSSA
jgi:hypothetical protein